MRYDVRNCRFCGKSAHASRLIKYTVRGYAHPQCYLDAGKSIDKLPEFPRGQLRKWLDRWVSTPPTQRENSL